MKILKSAYQIEVINRVKSLRVANGISQIMIAGIIDVSNGYVGNVESTKFRHRYTLKQLWIIANHFGVSLDYLLTGKNETLSTEQIINYLISYDE